ncbi:VWA domain-containing protein [Luteolibacter luteus]|uniref:VWA domain-containing protein n=1 Tax=Luteolibacter luteus TaxID=2728835 RepID=A0A858RQM9_9BACT|nr:VWA domain-containing protein [Luteolibacter luteus]QJE98834.1 VWA domain-containing protein [Luteolibacter luteus]
MIADFHFLRPWWLLALLPALLLAWGIRQRTDGALPWRGIVAEHLVPYLVTKGGQLTTRWPLRLLLAGWISAILVLAGPAWKREPSLFADDVAALAVVVKVSPSMQTEDLPPNRMARSVQKVHDLLSRRGAAKSALIAYAGSAHVVMPATSDAGIIDIFAAPLEPGIMPQEGDSAAEALKLADTVLAGAGGGSILWITDGIAPEQAAELAKWRKSSHTPVKLLAPLGESPELKALRDAADTMEAQVVMLSADDSDIAVLERAAKFSAPAPGNEDARWKESGYALLPLLALMLLPFFRKGWMPTIAARL